MANPYPLRLPSNLRSMLQIEADKCHVTLASYIVRACWRELERGSSVVEQHPHKMPDAGSIPAPASKLGLDALRAICAGNVSHPPAIPDAEPDTPLMCDHVEWVEAEGESYSCCRPAGHKGPCKRGDKL